ncbi:MAG TPA: DNA mismatch repair endonuclease MutL [Parachlamydiaceae bacterium]|nr:DNA mismatch repair endonuclease MutL [Parachlamydiaceae bacterium]
MSSKIRVLSDHTINKIAAGEVIENPASVVKELVENSLDAGATDICIEIQGGGRQMIRISDNGCGMNSDDALLCLERHATSKLREVEEIHSLSTMGFRGEAIPSIASISKFNLLTCPAQESSTPPVGSMVIIDGGKIISCHPAARSQGTTIEVKSLFFNVPVRKKFLKSPSIDANEILKTVSLMALGYPAIKFQLINDGKNSLMAPSSKDPAFNAQLQERIENVLGPDFFRHTTYIEEVKDGITLKGVIGHPGYTRHNRTGQYLFINKRGVVSPLVAYAVKEGFGSSIPAGRFPVFVLHLQVAGDLVDVNVHPQKREVRLRQEQLIKELIIKAVRSGIRHDHIAPLPDSYENAPNPVFAEAFYSKDEKGDQNIPETWVFQTKQPHTQNPIKPAFAFSQDPQIGSRPFAPTLSCNEAAHVYYPGGTSEPSKFTHQPAFQSTNQSTHQSTPSLELAPSRELPLKVMATIPGYLLLDGSLQHSFIEKGCRHPEKRGIVLIDQKNAHMRILFEKLSKSQSNAPVAQQSLLIPHTIELSPFESQSLRGAIPVLNKMGIQIREFGVNVFMIDSIPQMFGNSNLDVLIADIIHDLRSLQLDLTDEQIVKRDQAKLIAQAATRAAVSVQKRLSLLEAQSLLDQLIACAQPYLCPSGKPILAQLTSDELAKLFQR